MSKVGQNYSTLIGRDIGHCFLITGALLVIDSCNFGKTLQIRIKLILNCPHALRLKKHNKSWYNEYLTQKSEREMENKWFWRSWILVKVRWQFAGPTYCRSMGCCQIESCALCGNFVSCHAKFCLTIGSWHFGVHVCILLKYSSFQGEIFKWAQL